MSNNINCYSCYSCDYCNYCYSCYSCDYCNYCYSCYSCDSCYSCYSCDYCKNIKMTEYNLFCRAKEFNYENSFQQKRYRIFNKEISKDEYNKISIPKIKLEFDKNLDYSVRYVRAWNIARSKLSTKEKKAFTDLPHFNADIFREITGIDVKENDVEELTLADVCKELGRNIKIIK